jgi:hypothetical protein
MHLQPVGAKKNRNVITWSICRLHVGGLPYAAHTCLSLSAAVFMHILITNHVMHVDLHVQVNNRSRHANFLSLFFIPSESRHLRHLVKGPWSCLPLGTQWTAIESMWRSAGTAKRGHIGIDFLAAQGRVLLKMAQKWTRKEQNPICTERE